MDSSVSTTESQPEKVMSIPPSPTGIVHDAVANGRRSIGGASGGSWPGQPARHGDPAHRRGDLSRWARRRDHLSRLRLVELLDRGHLGHVPLCSLR